ncbi:hypothetical protein Ccrd_011138 [Cynara cardunculus var. scolymus]|uniref:ETFB lysine methyltransferase n=1 Tax=Cynara cardunculus var. scolymus TaxID=59895 RepID=A0A103YK24_CYNCS|nr:hypothetical protein Ccrd_011138 [Cynara cardunculus var. scolymus]
MSMLLASFRSHFFKHLACTSFSSIRNTSTLTHGSTSMLIGSTRDYPSRKLTDFLNSNPITAAFSTSSSSVSETSTSGSYLTVDIQCRQDVAISFSSIFTVNQDVHRSISQAADSIGLKETPVYKVTVGYQSDWIENSRDLEATIISLNPGLAFGTGDHPTTKLCLLVLHGLIKGGEKVLDYGTGSGILAIAALKFGAASSAGLDIDPQAITAARHNADLNNIGPDKLQLQLVPNNTNPLSTDGWQWAAKANDVDLNGMEMIFEKATYDVVVANILLNPLLDLADEIVSYAKPAAVPTVVDRYSNLLEGMTVSKIDDWACISGKRKVKE